MGPLRLALYSLCVCLITIIAVAGCGSGTPTAPSQAGRGVSGLSLTADTLMSGDSIGGTVTLSAPAPGTGTVVNLSSSDAAVSVPATVTVASGATSATFSVVTKPIGLTTKVTIAAVTNGDRHEASVTVMSSPAMRLTNLSLSPSSLVGGQRSEGRVTLEAPAVGDGTPVMLSTSDGAASVPESITVPIGSTSATFTVATVSVPRQTAVVISATTGGERRQATLTIRNGGELDSITITPSTIPAGSAGQGTVRLQSSGPSAVQVSLSSSDPAVTVPSSVTVAAGASTATFPVTMRAGSSEVSATITATAAGTTRTATVRVAVLPPIPTLFSYTSAAGDYIGGGRSVTYTPSNGYFAAVSRCEQQQIHLTLDLGNASTWRIDMAAPRGSALAPGTYSGATRFPFQAASQPGLDVSGEARGCNRLYGSFNISQMVIGANGQVLRFRATFEQHCEQPTAPPLTGEISVSDVPLSNIVFGCF